MPAETPPPIVQAYALLLLLGGLACATHFLFFSKVPKRIDPEQAVPGWRLNFPDFSFGLFTLILSVLVIQTLLGSLTGVGEEEAGNPAMRMVLFGFATHLVALGVLYTFYRVLPGKFEEPFNRVHLSWPEALRLALYTFLASLPFIYSLGYAWQLLLEVLDFDIPPQETVELFSRIEQLPVLLLMIALTVLVAPLSEELLFRGCLYRFLKDKLSIVPALLVSGALFALLHLNLLTFVPLLVLGIAMGYAYEKTGSIKVPILFHAIFNLNTVIMLLVVS